MSLRGPFATEAFPTRHSATSGGPVSTPSSARKAHGLAHDAAVAEATEWWIAMLESEPVDPGL